MSTKRRPAKPAAPAEAMMPPLREVLRGRRIMLTGATGFLGKVVLYLLLRWHPELDRIYLLIRGDRRSAESRLRREVLDSPVMGPLREHLGSRFDRYVTAKLAVVPGDITRPGLVGASLPRFKRSGLDAVIHCAGLVNFEASLEKALSINTIGVRNVIDFCRRVGAAMLHVSTCYVAGGAEGQRFEDDVPEDWCPEAKRRFSTEAEIQSALRAVSRVEQESRDPVRMAEFGAGDDDGDEEERTSAASLERRRKAWVEERFKEIGKARAESWGWPNTYSYTKSLGEQLVLKARRRMKVTVVRPAVIESALRDPFAGWNQGVNTSAPLTYLAGRGYRFYPARPDLVLDVIPVDLAAHAIIPILAALLQGRHQPIYQLATSDRNPLTMRRLVELTGLGNRREQRLRGGAAEKLAPHLEAVVVSQTTYDLAARALPSFLKRAVELGSNLLGANSGRRKKIEAQIDRLKENTDLARSLVEIYHPYIQELAYTFHASNIRALYRTLRPRDAARHPFAPERIDWADYWINVHLPGLRRHIFPQLDLHTRGRARPKRRELNLVEMLRRSAEHYGSCPALVARELSGDSRSLTYRELYERARRGGQLLARRGVRPGDRVLLIGENSPEWVLGYFAILSAGAAAVPLDHQISPDELAPICRISEPRAALWSEAAGRRLKAQAEQCAPEIVALGLNELRRPFIIGRNPPEPPKLRRDTLASLVFTSGTTGAPKGVMLTHGNFTAEVAMLARVYKLDGDDTLLSLLPLHHTFEFTCGMLLPLASGARITYPLGVDARNLSRTLAHNRPTALIGVPALWEAIHRRILDEVEARGPFFQAAFDQMRELSGRMARNFGLNPGALLFRQAHAALGGRLRLAVSGGAPLAPRVAEFFNDLGIRLLEGYGLTEAAPVLTAADPDGALKPGSVGPPLRGVQLRLEDARDGIGEILARGPNVMKGYYRNPRATQEALHDGWLHTGDLGRFDSDGDLRIVGRAKEVIVDSGGHNIYIDELEEAYGRSPYVKEMAVVGLRIGHGEQVGALVVPAYARGESRRAVEEKLRTDFDGLGSHLSPHKRIRILRFTDEELPRTRTRKIRRPLVVAMLSRMVESGNGAGNKAPIAAAGVEPWLAQALSQVATDHVRLSANTRLIEDLGLDSLALAEVGEHIAERAGRDIEPDEMANLRTVADLERLASQAAGHGRARMPSYARFADPYTPRLPGAVRRLARSGLNQAQGAVFDLWLQPRILGRGNVPRNRNFLVVANHSSHFDFGLVSHALGAMGRDLVVLAAKDYFFNTGPRRFLAWNFTSLIPFDRERAQMESLDEALAHLAAGRSVLMFPEGTRSADGAVHDFKSGAGYLALRSGCDVLPILIRGTHEVLGKGRLLPRHHPVEVRIGRVMEAARLAKFVRDSQGAGAYRRIAGLMRDAVVNLGEPGSAARRTKGSSMPPPDVEPPAPETEQPRPAAGKRRGGKSAPPDPRRLEA